MLMLLPCLGIIHFTPLRAQQQEQLVGFGKQNIYCRISYEMTAIGKGEYLITAKPAWIGKKGEARENPGICLDLGFTMKPQKSLEAAPYKGSLSTAEKPGLKYLIKVLDDREEISLKVLPALCRSTSKDGTNGKWEISNAIPLAVRYSIPAGILSPQHFSPDQLPDIVLVNEVFRDENMNNLINAGETSYITFDIPNLGVGVAHDVKVHMDISEEVPGLYFPAVTEVGDIDPGDTARVELPVKAGMALTSGMAEFKIEARERNGFDAFPLFMKVETMEYYPPDVFLADHEFIAEGSDRMRMNYPIILKTVIQNKGRGEARDYKVQFRFINNYCVNLSDKPTGIFEIPVLGPGDYDVIDFMFLIKRAYEFDEVPIAISILDGSKQLADTVLSVGLDESLPERITSIYAEKPIYHAIQIMTLSSFVDKNIPETGITDQNKFALIIGNEDYAKYQRGLERESNVVYARNDAQVFRDYANKTLGVPEGNTYLLLDATAGQMQQKIDLVSRRAGLAGPGAEVLVYYAGHGYPDELTKIPHLIPVDVTARDLSSAIGLSDMITKLGSSGAGKVIVILDACFSGGARNEDLLASRGVRIKPYSGGVPDNVLLISAASATQSALPYDEEYHGLFTYYMLWRLQETEGNITYGELYDYLRNEVPKQSLRINEADQEPDVKAGMKIQDEWRGWMLR